MLFQTYLELNIIPGNNRHPSIFEGIYALYPCLFTQDIQNVCNRKIILHFSTEVAKN